jgi:hypothetical protein
MLREEKDRVLRKRDEVTGYWRNLRNEELPHQIFG